MTNFKATQYMLVGIILLYTIVDGAPVTRGPYPFDAWDIHISMKENTCTSAVPTTNSDRNIKILCQKCAKATKSSNVYEMCCSNEEEVRTWCSKALAYPNQS